ncbi:family 78 glycoside hydrolase catalytic domain [Mediterraneibacter massiliensis]|uniref:family 78 glycoside hydrolase catalytic domain n=1 Tax=Mediterraneibacter massiliensis TaxID=1720300 RepID=UPI000E5007CB|nr:family 78 glycoside hydrolase catalytic domain [Mediterraneibacter massiliensis]RGT74104.1 alpha-L-rhamnosidase [Ruminococcus sp. AF18-22]
MLKIAEIQIQHQRNGCITDSRPEIRFALQSDRQGEELEKAVISTEDWEKETTEQLNTIYMGPMRPFTEYRVCVTATGRSGEQARADACFMTGRLDQPWTGRWITDKGYTFPKGTSPVPMCFKKAFACKTAVKRAWICCTALGIYEIYLNEKKVGKDYFAPGFTSYEDQIQYQIYDITEMLGTENSLKATVGGGWAAGTMLHRRASHISCDRQAFLAEIYVEYTDGTRDTIETDSTWQVSEGGPVRMAEWYDGETYDATVLEEDIVWKAADITGVRKTPKLLAQYGEPVRVTEVKTPVQCFKSPNGEWIYDFGQNFAGVAAIRVKKAKKGQILTFRHAEILIQGELFVKSLRTAKATVTYICKEGEQTYSPHFTYMGFRYVGMRGIQPEDIEVSAYVLHANMAETGTFTCSDMRLKRLYENIRWSAKSNFVDIPTDCPQRDERLGWTGDIAVFSSTAACLFDMSRFFDKWLLDVLAQQGKGGGFPVVIPKQGMNFTIAVSCWGDCCVLVPWAEYLARGDRRLLKRQYPAMKKYLKAAAFWCRFMSFGKEDRYIWRRGFHFGDWCAPEGNMRQWMKKGKWTATAYLANAYHIVSQIAEILGEKEEAARYKSAYHRIQEAYRRVFTDGKGTLLEEFQTGYVLPLHFRMVSEEEGAVMAKNLVRLIHENGGRLATGFPATPYILFALSDHGYVEEAYKLLLQEECPGWMYEVKTGATTIWERWDALRPDGSVNLGRLDGKEGVDEKHSGMVSFNHYAYGAVGDWFYKRIIGIEAVSSGYKKFRIAPKPGGGLTEAEGSIKTPYGTIVSSWKIADKNFKLHVKVPVSTVCEVEMPDGTKYEARSGEYAFVC